MDAAGIIVGLSDILVGGLVILLAGPLIRGEVKMNGWYGVRAGRAFESEQKWLDINRFGGRQLRTWGSFILAAGFVALLFDLDSNPSLLMLFVLAPLLLLIPALQAVIYARRA
jgi:uncharacterized membrane protein